MPTLSVVPALPLLAPSLSGRLSALFLVLLSARLPALLSARLLGLAMPMLLPGRLGEMGEVEQVIPKLLFIGDAGRAVAARGWVLMFRCRRRCRGEGRRAFDGVWQYPRV